MPVELTFQNLVATRRGRARRLQILENQVGSLERLSTVSSRETVHSLCRQSLTLVLTSENVAARQRADDETGCKCENEGQVVANVKRKVRSPYSK